MLRACCTDSSCPGRLARRAMTPRHAAVVRGRLWQTWNPSREARLPCSISVDHSLVRLIGVSDPDGEIESFVYSTNAPTNLFVSALCVDGSRMDVRFMAHLMNRLIDADAFQEGSTIDAATDAGLILRATVGPLVAKESVEAFQSET